ncbi:MAG TPA: SOS response-associated peptidase family protein, partial [Arenibacter sp.]|nr:SOS response-associated peptidase family protein [Arenibacter sp.]
NGLEEATISIMGMEEKQYIVPAIWGILPEDYSEDWHVFQNVFTSLNLNIDSLNNPSWFANALLHRRCLIPVTGFFTSYLINGVLYPYYFHLKSGLPFCLTGIYNKTEDGFLTCSVITTHSDYRLNDIQNLDLTIPILLPKNLHDKWLSEDLKEDGIQDLLHAVPNFRLIAHPISKEFFNNNISYSSMLAPVFYDAVPKQIVLEQGLHFLSL